MKGRKFTTQKNRSKKNRLLEKLFQQSYVNLSILSFSV